LGQLAHPFAFISGRSCRTLDDLVQGCQLEWDEARDRLRRGDFTRYFQQVNRHDLARLAREAMSQADADVALYTFVHQLPSTLPDGPRLDFHPRRMTLGAIRAGEQRPVRLMITNGGKGTLQGKLAISDGTAWLKPIGGNSESEYPLQTPREQQVALLVDTHGLIAGQSYSAILTLISNGGIAEVPVRLDVAASPFAQAPYQGASSPRALAERIRKNPKPAVPQLESGEVARWFSANGWSYPVDGTPARGMAAVQQFFECLGLSKPPSLMLSEGEVRITCRPREPVEGKLLLRTASKKWVYANIDSDAPWLRVTTPAVSGPQQAAIRYEVDSDQLPGIGTHQANLRIVANAGQKLTARILVDVPRPKTNLLLRLVQPFVVGALAALFLRLVLALPGDVVARLLQDHGSMPAPGSGAFWARSPMAEVGFLRVFVLATWWVGGIVGVSIVWRRGGNRADLVCGLIAGAAAGLAVSATAGSFLALLDGFPRTVLVAMCDESTMAGSATLLWLSLASMCWAVLGGGVGFLLCASGPAGTRVLAACAAPLSGVCRWLGHGGLADFFALQ
jgi:hypothetical protein